MLKAVKTAIEFRCPGTAASSAGKFCKYRTSVGLKTQNSCQTSNFRREYTTDSGTHHGHDKGRRTRGSGQMGFESGRTTMKSWEINSYGGLETLQLNEAAKIPSIRNPTEVLVRVKAASVNPLDVEMTSGYGSQVFQTLRNIEKRKLCGSLKDSIEFPLTMGRDFAGIVMETGAGVKDINVGDEVYGVLRFTEYGSHAEYTVARSDLVLPKPSHLSFSEAASFPYAGLTCWSAFKIVGNYLDLENKRILVLGGSGGVGTFAVQYLRAEGAEVVSTCSADAIPLLESLGLMGVQVVDYNQPDALEQLQMLAPFDCILNLAGPKNNSSKYLSLLKPVFGQFITMSPPSLGNYDQYGFFLGTLKNTADLVRSNFESVSKDRVVTKWGFFVPSVKGLRSIGKLIEKRRITPVIESTFGFSDIPRAYQRVAEGHLRGKVVVEV